MSGPSRRIPTTPWPGRGWRIPISRWVASSSRNRARSTPAPERRRRRRSRSIRAWPRPRRPWRRSSSGTTGTGTGRSEDSSGRWRSTRSMGTRGADTPTSSARWDDSTKRSWKCGGPSARTRSRFRSRRRRRGSCTTPGDTTRPSRSAVARWSGPRISTTRAITSGCPT